MDKCTQLIASLREMESSRRIAGDAESAELLGDAAAEIAALVEVCDSLQAEIAEYVEAHNAKNDPVPDVCCDDRSAPEPLFICDRRACDTCHPECMHTKDLRHAKHFEASGCRNLFVEQEAI